VLGYQIAGNVSLLAVVLLKQPRTQRPFVYLLHPSSELLLGSPLISYAPSLQSRVRADHVVSSSIARFLN